MMSHAMRAAGDDAAREVTAMSIYIWRTLGGSRDTLRMPSNIGDDEWSHTPRTVVMMTAVLGSDLLGDQTVNVEGCGVESS